MIKKILRKTGVKIIRKAGYSTYTAPKFFDCFVNDLFNLREVSFKDKIWAYQRGFFSEQIKRYNLNDSNYKDYLSDFDYMKLQPINKMTGFIDDKLKMRYAFDKFADYMPKYFYLISYGKVYPLIDTYSDENKGLSNIFDLVEKEGNLALKPCSGTGGQGFIKLSYKNKDYFLNNRLKSKKDVEEMLGKLKNYLVTQYLIPHQDIRKIYENTPNVIRLVVINDRENSPQITAASIRFGTKVTGMIDNSGAGAVHCGVDIESGRIFNPRITSKNRVVELERHPESNVPIKGLVPHWDFIKTKVKEICCSFPNLIFVGFDIVVTDKSFKFIEINSHLGSKFIQTFYPFMKNEYSKNFFNELLTKKRLSHKKKIIKI
ncbi:MAG: sugar-transfer associated ATP-grasp domain-containing protein [Desulforegulaceae bacterium]|nr:sugar-transfer associated ATP-grasp domain-containing protein [Desulforegulaceae bacterium]